ncbi:MAG: hypothetical protein DWQ31_06735 [Planctomycetota bacterium]|nr:MAG: hypothetical protein DWQ31_06735 [Planctomycetota bacterium]REJ90328.1 MAG: hypothetical protein DWQ35_16770 [Planctomycetota bacterium]
MSTDDKCQFEAPDSWDWYSLEGKLRDVQHELRDVRFVEGGGLKVRTKGVPGPPQRSEIGKKVAERLGIVEPVFEKEMERKARQEQMIQTTQDILSVLELEGEEFPATEEDGWVLFGASDAISVSLPTGISVEREKGYHKAIKVTTASGTRTFRKPYVSGFWEEYKPQVTVRVEGDHEEEPEGRGDLLWMQCITSPITLERTLWDGAWSNRMPGIRFRPNGWLTIANEHYPKDSAIEYETDLVVIKREQGPGKTLCCGGKGEDGSLVSYSFFSFENERWIRWTKYPTDGTPSGRDILLKMVRHYGKLSESAEEAWALLFYSMLAVTAYCLVYWLFWSG